jgi:hypothetical protein
MRLLWSKKSSRYWVSVWFCNHLFLLSCSLRKNRLKKTNYNISEVHNSVHGFSVLARLT